MLWRLPGTRTEDSSVSHKSVGSSHGTMANTEGGYQHARYGAGPSSMR